MNLKEFFKLLSLIALGIHAKKSSMLHSVTNKKIVQFMLATVTILLVAMQPVLSQKSREKKIDTLKTNINDTLLPTLVMKVASYTATIDHTDFLIRRKFNITPISFDLPEIERKVKGFKSRLEKRGGQMNLRSLNSGVIMLNQISHKLASYERILTTFSNELAQSHAEVKKILHDPILKLQISDSILLEQM